MLNKYLLAAVAAGALSACEAPSPGMNITPEAMARSQTMNPENIIPNVTPDAAMSAFDSYCGRYAGNPAGTRRAVEANGYYLFGTVSAQNLQMWASDNDSPLVALGREDGTDVCMVMIQEGQSIDSAIASYVAQKHGGAALSMGSMDFGGDTAENLYVLPSNPPLIYFTLVQTQPGIGRVQAIATVTE